MPTYYDPELMTAKLRRWEKYLREFNLPEWEELPAFELYMDQVIALLSDYLNFLLYESRTDSVITASTVNNYVRMKIMPPPVKKRYSRLHLAYLIIICTMKQSLNIAYVQKMIPLGISEDEVRKIYNDFVAKHKETSVLFISQLRTSTKPVFEAEVSQQNISNVVAELALYANLYKLLTEKLINLEGETLAQVAASHSEQLEGGFSAEELPQIVLAAQQQLQQEGSADAAEVTGEAADE